MRTRQTPLLLISLVTFATFVLSACSEEQKNAVEAPEKLPPVHVTLMTAQKSSPLRQVEIMGTLQAAESASIAARISGNITQFPVNLGSRVKKGDLLVSISAGEISAKLLQAKTQYEQVARNLTREQSLLKKNAATAESVKTLEESKRIAEAVYTEAQTMLSYTSIKAPFDGVVTQKTANIGDLATPGKPLLQLENESELQVITDIPEAMVLNLSIGDKLPVYIPAADLSTTGTVVQIAPGADPRSRSAPVKLNIEQQSKIRSGQFARVSLPGASGSAIMLPQSAVQLYGQMELVFIVKDKVAHLQLVKTGLRYGDQIEILAGVTDGDQVITTGNRHLKDGQPVTFN